MPDWPLPLRLALTGLAIIVSAAGFSTGSVVIGIAGIGLTILAVKRMILTDLPQHRRDDD